MTAHPTTAPPAPQAPAHKRQSSRRSAEATPGVRRIAGLHRQGDTYRLVVARLETPASAPVVVDSRSIPVADAAALAGALAAQKVDLLIRVVPSGRTIARCLPLPGSNGHGSSNGVEQDRDQLAAALALMAESELPAMLPAHRRAAGVIRPGPEAAEPRAKKTEAALLTGWPIRADEATPAKSGVKEEAYTAEIAALAFLARSLGGATLALYADRDSGAVAMLAGGIDDKGAPRIAARVFRADTSSAPAWRASIEASGAEIAGADGPLRMPASDAPTLLIIDNLNPRRVAGAPADPAWLSQYGIAFGAIAGAAQPDPAARSLASLSERSKADRPGALEGALEWMSVPSHGALVIGACVAVWLFWPLAIAAARHWALGRHTGGASALQERLTDAQRRASFYDTLKQHRWPMTKLMGDVAGAAPIGVTIDTLDLARDQGLSIRGKADTAELVTVFRKNLTDSSVFTDLATPSIEAEASGVSFQLQALVAAPLFPGKRAEDFRTNTLAVRLYGPSAAKSGSAPAAGAEPTPTSTPPGATSAPRESSPGADTARPTRAGRNGRAARDDPAAKTDEPGRRSASTGAGPPPPISDAEIAKLDRTAAMKEWTTRKSASSKPDLDAAVKQRLIDESVKCKARFDEVKNQGGT